MSGLISCFYYLSVLICMTGRIFELRGLGLYYQSCCYHAMECVLPPRLLFSISPHSISCCLFSLHLCRVFLQKEDREGRLTEGFNPVKLHNNSFIHVLFAMHF